MSYLGDLFVSRKSNSNAVIPSEDRDRANEIDTFPNSVLPFDAPIFRGTRYQEIKHILGDGARLRNGNQVEPFCFHGPQAEIFPSENAGLEGFLFSERLFREKFGTEASVRFIDDYLNYSIELLLANSSAGSAVEGLRELRLAEASKEKRYARFMEFIAEFVSKLQDELKMYDQATWIRSARIYQFLVPQFNLEGRREFYNPLQVATTGRFFYDLHDSDLEQLKSIGFDTVRFTGVYPIGIVGRSGTAQGSLFSIMQHQVDPAYGIEEEVRECVERVHAHGMKVIFEAILNHTSMDSKLLQSDPTLFVHTTNEPVDKTGYFYYKHPQKGDFWIRFGGYHHDDIGGRAYWSDVLQLDFSNPNTRKTLIQEVKELVVRYNIDGFRVDMAYQLLNDFLAMNWNGELSAPLPQTEFLEELISEIKSEFPNIAFVAEGYGAWEKLSECGFDITYGLNGMVGVGGHYHPGWYGALKSKDPEAIRNAIIRTEFLHSQSGSSDMLSFIGTHDQSSPKKVFGDWVWGATFLTLIKSGSFMFVGGTGAGFEAEDPIDGKMITFNLPVKIDWSGVGSEFGRFIHNIFEKVVSVRQLIPDPELCRLDLPGSNNKWVGFMIRSKSDPSGVKVLALANPTSDNVHVDIQRPEFKHVSVNLPACGKNSFELIVMD